VIVVFIIFSNTAPAKWSGILFYSDKMLGETLVKPKENTHPKGAIYSLMGNRNKYVKIPSSVKRLQVLTVNA